ncbi:unnamed protein product [Adineta steineri]|uniref:Uncharacterized protein n=2 Tax=Adineta steineri TaxID=433720 RepID=A0A818XI70_9BILA|nr:unnamed protein product [Adineta steineri]CAF3737434.1 unnamed protein product [Adineta steineri]
MEIVRLGLIGMILAASVMLLAILPAKQEFYGYSFQLMMAASALTQLDILLAGVQLGRILQTEPIEMMNICTELTISSITRGLAVLVAIFTIVGMSTTHWVGENTGEGWIGAGTFCRQSSSIADPCRIPISTTILSIIAAIVSLFVLVLVVCSIFTAIRRQVECYILPTILFPLSILLWFTIVTTMHLETTGYSYRVIIAAGPLAQLALFIGGIWLSISNELPDIIRSRF